MKGDSLGDRIKNNYENRMRILLPRRTYTIIRVDGKAFHTWTKGFDKPFDLDLMGLMDLVAKTMCEEIQGVKLAYVQSDEISLLLTDFETPNTEAWFNGNMQKMVSISACIAATKFNDGALDAYMNGGIKKFFKEELALFDSRVFTITDPIEVENYFIWRQQDATRNSIQMAARALYSHNECNNKNMPQLHDMMHEKGVNWNNYSAREKRGGLIYKVPVTVKNQKTGEDVDRMKWTIEGAPIFTQERAFFRSLIPRIPEDVNETNEEETT